MQRERSRHERGRLKEAAGDLTDDERLRQEGRLDQAKGQVERDVGDLKEKAADALADVMDDRSPR